LFFFSSRRRHTRSKRDWSSDVCSSDLRLPGDAPDGPAAWPERSADPAGEVLEVLGAEDRVPRQPRTLGDIEGQAHIRIRQWGDDEPCLQTGQSGNRVRPGGQSMPGEIDLIEDVFGYRRG